MAERGNRITIVDIANRAGVSFKTVSRVLNGNDRVNADLRDKVLGVMRELNYRPNTAARSLAGSRSFGIGLLIGSGLFPAYEDDSSVGPAIPSFFTSLQSGAIAGCRKAGYQLVIETVDIRSKRLAAELRQQFQSLRVDGVLLSPPLVDMPIVIETLMELDIAVARVMPGSQNKQHFSLSIDDHAAARAMTDYLLEEGHRRIGFIRGPTTHIAASRRLAGHLEALGTLPSNVMEGDFGFDSGMRAALDLLRPVDAPTAIFASNDDMAAGVVAAAMRLGLRVPQDLSVAGFDDSPIATLIWPPLTTVRQPIAMMARVAVERLIAVSRGDVVPDQVEVEMPYRIVKRQSVTSPASEPRG